MLAVSVFVFLSASNLKAQDSPQAINVLSNPGFEEGVKGWGFALTDKDSGICDKVFHNGKYSVLVKCKGEGKLQYISQTLPLPLGGSKVDCSVWVKALPPGVVYQVYCDITAQKAGGDPEYFTGFSTDIRKNWDGEWNEVKLSFTFPADQKDKDGNLKTMRGIYFRLATMDKFDGELWFDDASVVITPPAETVNPAK